MQVELGPRLTLSILIAMMVALGSAAVRVARAAPPSEGAAQAVQSPRAAMARFLELERAGRHAEAATYLELPPGLSPRGGELARRFKAVLDRHVWIELDSLSDGADGNSSDGLAPLVDEVASIPVPGGTPEPVRMVKREGQDGRWLFTRGTVERIDAWYGNLSDRFLREHLPPALLAPGPKELLWWQWLALPFLVVAAWILGGLLGRLSRRILRHGTRGTSASWDDSIVDRLGGPLTLGWTIALLYLALPWLGLYEPALVFVNSILRGALFVTFFWAMARCIDVTGQVVLASRWGATHSASRSLVAVGGRTAKLLVLAMGIVALLSELGYPVASLIAGLGIGGLAFALAAQKTVENLFGAFSIAADQPFQEGDFVKVDDFVGTVEVIGLRSTRIRTLDRTLITVPNGKLAEMRLETFAARDRIRLSCVLGMVYQTKGDQMRVILTGIERVLREHPKIWQDAVIVRFREFAASSLDIEVMAWFETSDYGEFQLYRQEVLLRFMEVVERAGGSFAFPTRTVHVVS